MNSFNSTDLSPLQKDAIACDLPYGLTWECLLPILPGFSTAGLHQAQAFATHDKQGLNGGENSRILTIRYPTRENGLRSETVFIKHTEDPDKAEEQKYLFLAVHGVPGPRLLGKIKSGDAETIFLEFLPTIGIDFSSASEVHSLLELAAKINSIQKPPDPSRIQSGGLPQAEFDELVRSALIEFEQAPALTPANIKIDPSRWFNAYQIARKAAETIPLALNHNQFYFQQVGWAQRGVIRQLVVFDLETLYLSPRFSDISGILYPLSIYTGRDELELLQIYLDRFNEFTHLDLDIDEALPEFRYTRIVYLSESLPWLAGEAKDSDAVEMRERLSIFLCPLWEDITNLGL